MTTRLVVLDRDGVINQDSDNFVRSADDWCAIEGSVEGIALLSNDGFTVAVATNQSGLARGYFDQAALDGIHAKMRAAVVAAGGHIDRVVFCPHGPDERCQCRKPEPGLLHQLGTFYGIDMRGIPFIGDSDRDLVAARHVGGRPILVRTGKGVVTERLLAESGRAVEVYDDLLAAARALVAGKNG